MSEELNRYTVTYHTAPAPSSTYYRGKQEVYAQDEEDAAQTVQRDLTRPMAVFFDRRPSSIVIEKVELKR